jgi:hypothetical protein
MQRAVDGLAWVCSCAGCPLHRHCIVDWSCASSAFVDDKDSDKQSATAATENIDRYCVELCRAGTPHASRAAIVVNHLRCDREVCGSSIAACALDDIIQLCIWSVLT